MTQTDIDILKGGIYNIKFKLELLSNLYLVEKTLEGTAKSISGNCVSDSDVRRTCTIVINVENTDFIDDDFEIAWLDKLLAPYIGVEHNGTFTYYKLGTFALNTDTSTFDASTNELTLNLLDLMCTGTSARGNQIGTDVIIPVDSNVRNSIISVVSRFMPFKLYDVCEFEDTVPYDLEFSAGVYPYDILDQLMSLYPYYEMYYDVDGIFTVKQVPTGVNDPIFLDTNVMDDLIISEGRSGTIGNIKNSTEIWGAELDAMYTATSCISEKTGNMVQYQLVIPYELETIENGSTYSFVPGIVSTTQTYISISGLDEDYRVVDSNGNDLIAGAMVANRSYVVKFVYDSNLESGKFRLQGEQLVHVIVREMNNMPTDDEIAEDKERNDCYDIKYVINPYSPYACDRNGKTIVQGEIRQVLRDGDYAYIYTTQLAYERGAYENYCKARLNTDVELKTVMIPFLDVNKKIKFTSPKTGQVYQYMVKEIDFSPMDFTMTMKLSRFYNAYPWL